MVPLPTANFPAISPFLPFAPGVLPAAVCSHALNAKLAKAAEVRGVCFRTLHLTACTRRQWPHLPEQSTCFVRAPMHARQPISQSVALSPLVPSRAEHISTCPSCHALTCWCISCPLPLPLPFPGGAQLPLTAQGVICCHPSHSAPAPCFSPRRSTSAWITTSSIAPTC